jgi:hypothetical protein
MKQDEPGINNNSSQQQPLTANNKQTISNHHQQQQQVQQAPNSSTARKPPVIMNKSNGDVRHMIPLTTARPTPAVAAEITATLLGSQEETKPAHVTSTATTAIAAQQLRPAARDPRQQQQQHEDFMGFAPTAATGKTSKTIATSPVNSEPPTSSVGWEHDFAYPKRPVKAKTKIIYDLGTPEMNSQGRRGHHNAFTRHHITSPPPPQPTLRSHESHILTLIHRHSLHKEYSLSCTVPRDFWWSLFTT